jgi:heptosyltransferase I
VHGSSLVLANDSAALHMAVGFDRPSIGLFGPTRVELVGPYQKHKRNAAATVIQHIGPGDRVDHKDAASGRALMERIGVEEVLDAVGMGLQAVRSAASR